MVSASGRCPLDLRAWPIPRTPLLLSWAMRMGSLASSSIPRWSTLPTERKSCAIFSTGSAAAGGTGPRAISSPRASPASGSRWERAQMTLPSPTCIFVNNGLLRLQEPERTLNTFQKNLGMNIRYVDATEGFLDGLKGIVDPEQRRRE